MEDAEELLNYLKIVGGETDFLLADENGIDGLTLEGERDWITGTLKAPNTKMFLGVLDGEIVLVCDVRAAGRKRIAHVGGVAISIKRAYWHLGIGSIAMQAMIDFARSTNVLRSLSLEVHAENSRAIALYKPLRFCRGWAATRDALHVARAIITTRYLMDLDLAVVQ